MLEPLRGDERKCRVAGVPFIGEGKVGLRRELGKLPGSNGGGGVGAGREQGEEKGREARAR